MLSIGTTRSIPPNRRSCLGCIWWKDMSNPKRLRWNIYLTEAYESRSAITNQSEHLNNAQSELLGQFRLTGDRAKYSMYSQKLSRYGFKKPFMGMLDNQCWIHCTRYWSSYVSSVTNMVTKRNNEVETIQHFWRMTDELFFVGYSKSQSACASLNFIKRCYLPNMSWLKIKSKYI